MAGISTRSYALVVVRLGPRFALVQETGGQWYLPAGRVEPGESFFEAARRETKEEAGLDIELTGILRVEHTPGFRARSPSRGDHAADPRALPREPGPDATQRLRVIFTAAPLDPGAKLKVDADQHSVQAKWLTFEEARRLPLRGGEVVEVLRYVECGGAAHPLSLLTTEGAPYRE